VSWERGKPLSPVDKGPITRDQLRAYAAASGDSNPIHLDEEFAREAGFPSVIAHGMLSAGFLSDLLAANFPEDGFQVVRFKTRFRKITFPGDTLRCEGKVKAVTPEGVIQVDVSAVNQKGEVTTDGEADIKAI